MTLPLLDTGRAERELGWRPVHSGIEAVEALLEGWRVGADLPTPPLALHAGGVSRLKEVATGICGRDTLAG